MYYIDLVCDEKIEKGLENIYKGLLEKKLIESLPKNSLVNFARAQKVDEKGLEEALRKADFLSQKHKMGFGMLVSGLFGGYWGIWLLPALVPSLLNFQQMLSAEIMLYIEDFVSELGVPSVCLCGIPNNRKMATFYKILSNQDLFFAGFLQAIRLTVYYKDKNVFQLVWQVPINSNSSS